MRAISLCLIALILKDVEANMCSLPTDGTPVACQTDVDCCGRQACVQGNCQMMGVSFNASESAFVTHSIINSAMFDMSGIAEKLDQASKAVAEASQAVAEATKEKVKTLKEKAGKLRDSASGKIANATAAAKSKAAQIEEGISRKSKEALVEDSAMISAAVAAKFQNNAAGGGPGGFDYGSFATPGGSSKSGGFPGMSSGSGGGFPGMPSGSGGGFPGMPFQGKSKGGDKPAAGFGGMDPKSFMPGSNAAAAQAPSDDWKKFAAGGDKADATPASDAKSKENKKEKSKEPAAPAGGAMDWKKFVPGMNSAAKEQGAAASPAAGGGMDWKKFVPGMSSAAKEQGAAGGGMDWQKFIPGSNSAAKKEQAGAAPAGGTGMDWKKFVPGSNSAEAQAEAAPADPNATGSNAGETGGPCGEMIYKDFGPCKKDSDECVKSPWPFSPGTCEDKSAEKDTAKATVHLVNAADTPVAGSSGGPCGFWEIGKMDFGDCGEGLICTPPHVKLVVGDKTYTTPSICKNASAATAKNAAVNQAIENAEAEAEAESAGDDSKEDIAKLANQVAAKADIVAEKAAAAAEVMAHKLLAASAELKKAAAKLKKDAADMKVGSNKVAMYESVDNAVPARAGWSFMTWFMLIAVGATAAYSWSTYRSNPYRRI